MIRRRLENYGGHVGNRLSVAAGVVLAAGMMAAFAPRAEAALATGGTMSYASENGTNYIVHTFTTVGSNSFSVTGGGNVDVLVVAGGGAGQGYYCGQGGGAGGLIYSNSFPVNAQSYAVTVGAGGISSTNGNLAPNGSNSTFGVLLAYGGGGGAPHGKDGGSGGGNAYGATQTRSQGTNGQGNAGGLGALSDSPTPNYGSGGGGGAGATGGDGTTTNGGNGGIGREFPQFASFGGFPSGWFAGGGGGSTYNGGTPGSGGNGGGGNGSTGIASPGKPNTGGGGGGGERSGGLVKSGGDGGSGIVIVRYVWTPTPSQMQITFGGYTNRSEVLTNFPVLVVFSNNINNSGFHYGYFATTNGYDLRFGTDSKPPTTGLNYEIESWNPNGASYVWVQVPTVPTNGTGAIWANWGNTSASNQLPCTTNGTTWTNRYAGVWHLPNGTTLNANDSTANRKNGTITSATATNGMSDGGAWLYNGTAYVQVDNITANLGNSNWSIGEWVRIRNGYSGNHEIWTKGSTGWTNPADKLARMVSDGTVLFHDYDGAAPVTTRKINDYNWHYVVHTYVKSSSNLKIYIDGAKDVDTTYATDSGDLSYFNIGKGPDNEWDGAMDEVRIATDASSDNWIWAEYMNMASNTVFNNYGKMEKQASPKGTVIMMR
jgi:hypothetical protein